MGDETIFVGNLVMGDKATSLHGAQLKKLLSSSSKRFEKQWHAGVDSSGWNSTSSIKILQECRTI
jgi:hypothetical protein